MDVMNVLGRTRDIVMLGRGNSTLDELVADIAREQGRTVKPDAEPEKACSTARITLISPNRAFRRSLPIPVWILLADRRAGGSRGGVNTPLRITISHPTRSRTIGTCPGLYRTASFTFSWDTVWRMRSRRPSGNQGLSSKPSGMPCYTAFPISTNLT